VSGYIYHTVPVALHAWFRHGRDLRAALPDVVACGGDADTVAAIAGGVMGAGAGKEGIPPEWLARLWEWPRSVGWMERLGRALCEAGRRRPLPLFWPGLVPRNLFFLVVVIVHVLRRWLPPY
jgi:ADP-ribosylglycohydrolase